MLPYAITLTERAVFVSLVNALQLFGLASSSPSASVEIVRGQTNRVPQPASPDHLVLWPSRRNRIATDVLDTADNAIIGSLSSGIMTVTSVLLGTVCPGQAVFVLNVIGPACTIVRQRSGDAGGAGTYEITPSLTVAAGTVLYCGTFEATQSTEMTVQVDVHGPLSADNAQRVSTLTRSWFGVEAFGGTGVTPLYADDPVQSQFIDGEDQTEERWTVDVHLQADPTIIVPQQFAAALKVLLVEVDGKTFWPDGHPVPPNLSGQLIAPDGSGIVGPDGAPVYA